VRKGAEFTTAPGINLGTGWLLSKTAGIHPSCSPGELSYST
jgi:hypothetical protein